MNNQEIINLTNRYVMSTYNRQPIALVRGEGTRVWDADGREYLDFVTGVAVNSLGHCHPKVVAAIREAAGRLIHCSNHYHIESQARLAAFLTVKAGMDKAFFMNSGSEAVEGAIKLARRYVKLYVDKERTAIISATNSFHGRTLGALTATGQPKYHEGFEPLVPDFFQVPLNDIAALEKAVDSKTAAVLLEPIQGEGGVHPCTKAYLQAARRLCTQYGIPLICDEVQTGLGRTGKWFAFSHYEVKPDIVAIAKALGGGVPIGAVLAVEEIAKAFSPGSHGSTFGGGPLATSAALAAMLAIEEENMVEAASASGAFLIAELNKFREEFPSILGEVRGAGCLIGIETKIPAKELVLMALRRGLLVNAAGDAVLRLMPPLNVQRNELIRALAILRHIVQEKAKTTS